MIQGLEIRCEPFRWALPHYRDNYEVRIMVKLYSGDTKSRQIILPEDELVSRFDQVWEILGKEFKEALLKKTGL